MTASEKSFLVMFLRHVCFVVLAVVFINLFPSKADRYSETEKRISAFANHLTATLAAETFKFTSPDNPKVTVRLIENETLEFQHTELSSYRPLNTRLVFCTDNFLNICFRIFCIAALMVLVCPSSYPRSLTAKLLSILSGAFCVPLIFFIRALLFGVLAHRFGVNVLGGTIDEIFRNALPFTIYIVVLRPKIPTFSKRKVQPALLLLLLSLVEGCGSALSNNHVSINLGGDNGMLYLVVAAFFAGSFFSNLTSKRRGRGATDEGEDRGRGEAFGEMAGGKWGSSAAGQGVAKPNGAAKKLTQKEVADLFGSPCNADMVGNWESYGKGGVKRGAVPPSAEYNGKLYPYVKELRTNPTPENMEILGAIAKRFRETAAVQDGIESGKFTHPRSDESLYRARRG